jgi:hypothetical protein
MKVKLGNQQFDFYDSESFILGCVGKGGVSRIIQNLSDPIPNIKNEEKFSHVGCGGMYHGKLAIAESHLKTGGCAFYDNWDDWRKTNHDAEVYLIQYNYLDLKRAIDYAHLKVPYGTVDLMSNAVASWTDLRRPDKRGMQCSEEVARIDNQWKLVYSARRYKSAVGSIGNFFHLVQPANIQRLFFDEGVSMTKLT